MPSPTPLDRECTKPSHMASVVEAEGRFEVTVTSPDESVGLEFTTRRNAVYILGTEPGSPAEKSGMRAGYLVKVNGTEVPTIEAMALAVKSNRTAYPAHLYFDISSNPPPRTDLRSAPSKPLEVPARTAIRAHTPKSPAGNINFLLPSMTPYCPSSNPAEQRDMVCALAFASCIFATHRRRGCSTSGPVWSRSPSTSLSTTGFGPTLLTRRGPPPTRKSLPWYACGRAVLFTDTHAGYS